MWIFQLKWFVFWRETVVTLIIISFVYIVSSIFMPIWAHLNHAILFQIRIILLKMCSFFQEWCKQNALTLTDHRRWWGRCKKNIPRRREEEGGEQNVHDWVRFRWVGYKIYGWWKLNPNWPHAAVGKVWKNYLPKEEGREVEKKMCTQRARGSQGSNQGPTAF